MDRLISDEERIRRAEDVLERRRNTDLRISSDNFTKSEPTSKVKKMFIQILVCLLIYCGIYYVKNSPNEKIKTYISSINSVLNYDVNFNKIYTDVCAKLEDIDKKLNKNNEGEQNQESQNSENNQNQDDKSSEQTQNENSNTDDGNQNVTEVQEQSSNQNMELGIGGSTEDFIEKTANFITADDEMKSDAEYIKTNFNIINPLQNSVVTSKFGTRNSTGIVSANHKGIDLGATTGTSIISAMDGTVIEASSKGDYGIHLKIQNNDVVVVYAHCSELLVKEGDKVNQGMEIAKVGSTGKATGPNLHFEIRRENRAVNPEYLLQF